MGVDYCKCPTCNGTGGTERVGTVMVGSVPRPQYQGEACKTCGGEGYVELAADDEELPAVAAE